jgi:regulator of sigma E protease
MFTVGVALLVIGILIFIHEFGHFLAAKKVGVKVEIFSLGFGPKILGFVKGETEYRLSLIPLGGYVKLYGEHAEVLSSVATPEKAFAFKKPWEKAIIVLAGPFANFLLAFFIFWMLFTFAGVYISPPVVGEVLKGSPAEKAGLKKGDRILEIDGKKVNTFEDLVLILRSKSYKGPVTLKIERKGKVFEVKVKPELREAYNIFGKKTKIPLIGIRSTTEIIHKKYDPLTAFFKALNKTWYLTSLTFQAIFKLLTGELPFSTLGGPLTIGKMAGDTARLGLLPLLSFTALLSVNLGVINIIPFPMLDGGHLVFFLIEAIRKKPIPLKTQEWIFKIGLALLILFSIAVFYNDLVRLFGNLKWKLH